MKLEELLDGERLAHEAPAAYRVSVLRLAAEPGATPGLHADPELGLVEPADIRDPLADVDGIVGGTRRFARAGSTTRHQQDQEDTHPGSMG